MGVGPPVLRPAPTEPSSLSSAAVAADTSSSAVGTTDHATDVSRRSDRTSYSLPEDGRPITISTRASRSARDPGSDARLARPARHSQTSLLIEYFEGGKGGGGGGGGGHSVQARPSVRVKVTPSAARKIKATNERIHITETGTSRRPSYTQRIDLPAESPRHPPGSEEGRFSDSADDRSRSSLASAATEEDEDSGRPPGRPPVEIEVMRPDDASPVSAQTSPRDARYVKPNPSEISAIPPDSLLDLPPPVVVRRRPPRRGGAGVGEDPDEDPDDDLVPAVDRHPKTPSRRRSRSRSRDPVAVRLLERLENRAPAPSGSTRKRLSKTRSRSVSQEQQQQEQPPPPSHPHRHHHRSDLARTSRRRSSKTHRDEDALAAADSRHPPLSPTYHPSADQSSFRSGTSTSSLNNPRLLATVEDAIKRLILPELSALKHEQRTQTNRPRSDEVRRESVGSGSVTSRDGGGGGRRRRLPPGSSPSDRVGPPRIALGAHEDPGRRGTPRSGDSVRPHRDRARGREPTESPSDRSHRRHVSDETLTDRRPSGRRRSQEPPAGTPDLPLGESRLTAAALRHHDSRSSVDRPEGRRRTTKADGRSRSASVDGRRPVTVEDAMPPLPLSSDVNSSELTRTSILTAPTDRPLSPVPDHGRRAVAAGATHPPKAPWGVHHHDDGSPDHLSVSADAHVPGRPLTGYVARAVQAGLAAAATAGTAAATTTTTTTTVPPDRRHLGPPEHQRAHVLRHRRSLSPIQSVASYQDDSAPERDGRGFSPRTQSVESRSTVDRRSPSGPVTFSVDPWTASAGFKDERARRERSDTYGRRLSPDLDDARRGSDYVGDETTLRVGGGGLTDDDHVRAGRPRRPHDPALEVTRATNVTDDDDDGRLDGSYLHKMAAGREVLGVGHNPEYRRTPVTASSAVASLHNPSVVDVRSTRSGVSRVGEGSPVASTGGPGTVDRRSSSPRHPRAREGLGTPGLVFGDRSRSKTSRDDESLARPSDRSLGEFELGASGLPVADDPMPEIGHGLEDESDMTTNPSIIHGPIGGVPHGNRDHWPYDPTPPQPDGPFRDDGLGPPEDHDTTRPMDAGDHARTATGLGLGPDANGDGRALEEEYGQHHDDFDASYYPPRTTAVDGYTDGVPHDPNTQATPLKDEGYITADNPRSPAAMTPEDARNRGEMDVVVDDPLGPALMGTGGDDPFFTTKHARHLSGNSHGMASPLYDGATGNGLDRIQSKDIVALMDHVHRNDLLMRRREQLTVRDAQRNARDTEILVTLVRSAAEMRNSFEDMKRLLAEQEMNIIESTEANTERSVQKVINGPRPQPSGTPRGPRRAYTEDETIEDLPTKKRNVFRWALKGLSTRSANDLSKIEDMFVALAAPRHTMPVVNDDADARGHRLVQLLGDVEGLKAAQDPRPRLTRPQSLDSYENARMAREGCEPEVQADVGSNYRSHSGYFSNPPSRQAGAMRSLDVGQPHEHRISTVPEDDEEVVDAPLETPYETGDDYHSPSEQQQQQQQPQPQPQPQPSQQSQQSKQIPRMSMPLDSPLQEPVPVTARSNDNTPKADKAKKHKSTASSIFPRISRWSETTASTVARQFRGGGRKEREYSEAASRSGSELDIWQYNQHDMQESDRLRSRCSLEDGLSRQGDRPSSPLVPQATQEDPKYQAHRDSQNLQHPQPRQGPTQRYQNQLESQAHQYDSPISPSSEQWTSNPTLARFSGGMGNRHSGGGGGHLSPISDGGYSQVSSKAAAGAPPPPRPPKVFATDDEPLMPQRPPKVAVSSTSSSSSVNKENGGGGGAKSYPSHLGSMGDKQYHHHRYSNGSGSGQVNDSPRSMSGRGSTGAAPPQRKPTGPRPISSSR